MLTELYIRNYLFVPEQRIAFCKGMTVISGETGAGKSILVGAISLIFGDTAPGLEPFDPAKPIYLEASFDISGNSELQDYLKEQGYEPESELCLAREIGTSGKSTYFLGGRKVSASLLKDLKTQMIDFHHQRDQQRLLSPAYQMTLLDLYAQDRDLLDSFAALYRKLRLDLKELERLRAEDESNRNLKELYQYQFEELESAALRENEDRELQQEFELLSHAREISETAGSVAYSLYDREESVHSQIRQALASVKRYAALNPKLGSIEQLLQECLELISEAASSLNDLTQSVSADPGRLEAIQERLDAINGLLYKHKVQTISELLALFAQRKAQIEAFADLGVRIAQLERSVGEDYLRLRGLGDKLTKARRKAADQLSRELQANIGLLSIPEAQFKIIIDKMAEDKIIIPEYLDLCSESGQDRIQFFFSANKGSDLKPLSAVASGGELSRVLLAIKKVLSERIEEKLIILDEIDAGIGGKTAEYVAQFIHSLASRHRILCITHLAQIAAIAHRQIALRKEAGKRKNVISMVPLDPQQRLEELARMLSGDVSPVSLRHAQELVSKYNK